MGKNGGYIQYINLDICPRFSSKCFSEITQFHILVEWDLIPALMIMMIFIIGFESKYFELPICLNIMSLHWHLISTDRQKVRLQFSEQSSIYFQLN